MGNSKQQLQKAIQHIQKKIGSVSRCSSLYSTAAWGNTKQPDFLNQVIVASTTVDAETAMLSILDIEKKMGRIRTTKNAPRIIDIDILFFNKEIIHTKNLQVPHPRIQQRNFVLVPLNELSPNFKHPVLQKTIHWLLINSPDQLTVKKF
jgi:2-amino-4-hydroxy-6-hydroxymethyldihydropteridine diphosphokinase